MQRQAREDLQKGLHEHEGLNSESVEVLTGQEKQKLGEEKKKNVASTSSLENVSGVEKEDCEKIAWLVEEHKREKYEALQNMLELVKCIDANQKLELEIEALKLKLGVMNHVGDEDDAAAQIKIAQIYRQLFIEHNFAESRKMQHLLQEHLQRALHAHGRLNSDLEKKKQKLESWKRELIILGCTEQVKEKHEVEKKKIDARNSLLRMASEEQRKADENVLRLVEEHKKEKDEALQKIVQLETNALLLKEKVEAMEHAAALEKAKADAVEEFKASCSRDPPAADSLSWFHGAIGQHVESWLRTPDGMRFVEKKLLLSFQLGQYGMQQKIYPILSKALPDFSYKRLGLPKPLHHPEKVEGQALEAESEEEVEQQKKRKKMQKRN